MSDSPTVGSYGLPVSSVPTTLPAQVNLAPDLVYEELNRLAELMPQRYAEVFRFRWGLETHFPHLISQTARKFEIPQSTAEEMLSQCLWNVARYAHTYELPAIRALVGEQSAHSARRAWQHADRRWGNPESSFSEAVLLLAAAGLDVREAHRRVRQHMVDIGVVGQGKRWGRPLTAEQQTAASKTAIDRIVQQVVWPSHPAQFRDLDEFELRRPLASWAPAKSGVLRSRKLKRLVQFDSELELVILRDLDTDPRVVDFLEQPLTIPYTVSSEAHEYTPDVIVQLEDSRAFVIEAKPPQLLGDFNNWMKWASLARWCEQHGVGFWAGSPQRSLIEHIHIQPDPEKHEFVRDEINAGPVTDDDYKSLERLVGYQQLGLIASADLLDWRTDQHHIKHPEPADRQTATELRKVLLSSSVDHAAPNIHHEGSAACAHT